MSSVKNIVITGSTKGIGFGLAREFRRRGHHVCICGRNPESLKEAKERLSSEGSPAKITALRCDILNSQDLEHLWVEARKIGPVDIWINNAGIGQSTLLLNEISSETISEILDTNLKAMIFASKLAMENMLQQGFGAIYNMEGFGSDGRIMKGMSIYGSSKRALSYFTRALAKEVEDSSLIVGSLSPGMVVTDLLTRPLLDGDRKNRDALKIFHILADRVETVTPFLAKRILQNEKNGASINWLTKRKIMARFIMSIIRRRKVEGLPEY